MDNASQESDEKKGWGGRRAGSGRPCIPDRVVKVVKMPASHAAKVNRYAEATGLKTFSAVVRRMIEELPELTDAEG